MKNATFMCHLVLLLLLGAVWEVVSWQCPIPQTLVPRSTATARKNRYVHAHQSKKLDLIPNQKQKAEDEGRNREILPSLIAASTLAICTCTQIATLPNDISHHAIAFEATPNQLKTTCKDEIDTSSFIQNLHSSSNILSSSQQAWMESLTPPTEEMPQIKPPEQLTMPSTSLSSPSSTGPRSILNNNMNIKNDQGKVPIVEGMVYMFDKNLRPDPSDIIVLTVTSPSQPDVILAGAKYPVYKARLPFNFQMFDKNIVGGQEGERLFRQAQDDGDLIVNARVCPEESIDGKKLKLPCDTKDSTYEAKSISKSLKVPGIVNEEVMIVRTPASLPLRGD